MFGISGAEFIVLLVVAVIFLGPKHAAQAVKGLRTALNKLRDLSGQLRAQLAENRTQAGLESLGITAEDVAALRELRATTGSLDPRAYVRKAVAEEMNAWLDVAPMPVQQAGNVPNSGKALSFEEARKKTAERKKSPSPAPPTNTGTLKAVESAEKENLTPGTENSSSAHISPHTDERKTS